MASGRIAALLCGALAAASATVIPGSAGARPGGPPSFAPGPSPAESWAARPGAAAPIGARPQPADQRSGQAADERRVAADRFERLRTAHAGQRLSLPEGAESAMRRGSAGPPRFRYAISVVAIPLEGRRLGFSRAGMAQMVNRIGRRMERQSVGRVGYRMRDWVRAPRAATADLPCDVDKIHRRYSGYAEHLDRTPRGYTDSIALFVTPLRARCPFAGSALLGGDGTYLNGVFLRDPQHLQDWITAHEIGHNLALVHSGSFYPNPPGWDIGTAIVPQNERRHLVAEYGDHLDVMGAPPTGDSGPVGTDLGAWALNAVTQFNLGTLKDRDVAFVERSGAYDLAALRPGGTPGAVSALAIQVVADRSATYWVMEYRPPEQNAQLRYPAPWGTAGYGARLILYEHFSRRWYHINKVLRVGRPADSPTALATGQRVRLGGGAAVEVVAVSPQQVTVVVTIPGAEAEPQEGATAARREGAAWRGW